MHTDALEARVAQGWELKPGKAAAGSELEAVARSLRTAFTFILTRVCPRSTEHPQHPHLGILNTISKTNRQYSNSSGNNKINFLEEMTEAPGKLCTQEKQ